MHKTDVFLVKDINPGPKSSSPGELMSFGDAFLFTAADGVYRSDGTEAGTVRLKASGSWPHSPVNADGTSFFMIDAGSKVQMTVNLQFRAKTDELTEVNNDMANLLNSAEISTVFLSNNLHIKRFTASITGLIPLVQTDVGRPITNLTTHLKYDRLVTDVKEVLARLSPLRGMLGNWASSGFCAIP